MTWHSAPKLFICLTRQLDLRYQHETLSSTVQCGLWIWCLLQLPTRSKAYYDIYKYIIWWCETWKKGHTFCSFSVRISYIVRSERSQKLPVPVKSVSQYYFFFCNCHAVFAIIWIPVMTNLGFPSLDSKLPVCRNTNNILQIINRHRTLQ